MCNVEALSPDAGVIDLIGLQWVANGALTV